VVCLKTLRSLGSGFFVTETGIVATNAHVARGDSSMLALLASGAQLDAKVVFIDPELDIALVKSHCPRGTHQQTIRSVLVAEDESSHPVVIPPALSGVGGSGVCGARNPFSVSARGAEGFLGLDPLSE